MPCVRRTRFLMIRIGLLETLTRSDPVIAQCSIAIEVVFGACQLSRSAAHIGRRLFDHRLVHALVGVYIGKSGPLGRNARLSAGELCSVISIASFSRRSPALTDWLSITVTASMKPATLAEIVVTSPPT